jgi:outer membrane protein assembly factor BamB
VPALGDPLMSQPAILRDRLFIAYPSGQRNPKHSSASNSATATVSGYHLLAVELKTGHHLWEREIPTDVISAPVLKENNVYVTCFDGSTFAFDASTGRVLWSKKEAATSAPLPIGDQVVFSKKKQSGSSQYEGLARVDVVKGDSKDKDLLASGKLTILPKEKDAPLVYPRQFRNRSTLRLVSPLRRRQRKSPPRARMWV